MLRLLHWFIRRRRERRAHLELRRLDDRMLRDIGLDRHQLRDWPNVSL